MANVLAKIHYRIAKEGAGGICGAQTEKVTRNKSLVSCRNCLRLMLLHGHTETNASDAFTQEDGFPTYKGLQRLCTEKQCEIAFLKADLRRTEEQLDKAVQHADAIQQLAAEGKDPLTGEEPEFWLVWRRSGGNAPSFAHATRESAANEADRLSRQHPGNKFYILPAFDYCICEVSPVTWKRKSSEKAPAEDDEIPF